jgi:hypothetical protein
MGESHPGWRDSETEREEEEVASVNVKKETKWYKTFEIHANYNYYQSKFTTNDKYLINTLNIKST